MAVFEKEHWKKLLLGLFDEKEAEFALSGLDKILDGYRAVIPSSLPSRKELSERDVILISYPDQLRENGVPPLMTLREFCIPRLRGLVNVLHILPFFPFSSDDGFSIVDFRRVKSELGTWEDVARLGADFRLMFDAVINHVSAQSAWFQAFLRGDPAYRGFFIEVEGNPDLSGVVRPRTSPLVHRFDALPNAKTVWTTFSRDQVDLNYRNPGVLLEAVDLLLFYAARGVEFIRLDAVAYLWKELGTPCINLPQTHRLVRLLHAILEEAAPQVKLITETNVSHAENLSYLGDGTNEAHQIYNFALPPLVLHTFLSSDQRPLSQWADGLSLPGRRTAFLNFLASHDGIGLNALRGILPEADIQQLVEKTLEHGGRVSFKQAGDGPAQPYELNINYFDALSNPSGNEPLDLQVNRFLAAHAILFSLPGIPAVYFHSLFGSRGWMEGVIRIGENRAINRQKLERAGLERELKIPTGIRRRVFDGIARLIRARISSPAFDPYGTGRTLDFGQEVFSLLRTAPDDGERVLCLHNISKRTQKIQLDFESIFGPIPRDHRVMDIITGKQLRTRRTSPIHLDPYQVCWFRSSRVPPLAKNERFIKA
jgi:glucosylglycerate phosphorylase